MDKTLLTTLVEEKLIMRYLTTIAPTEYAQAQVMLANCIGYGILTTILPFFEPEKHAPIVAAVSHGDDALQRKWLAQQPIEVRLSIRETVERIFLSLS